MDSSPKETTHVDAISKSTTVDAPKADADLDEDAEESNAYHFLYHAALALFLTGTSAVAEPRGLHSGKETPASKAYL
ncbi:hypothetical protein HGRIS_001194 [Hohenbuehelia grisea]|uniref:Uncharacterized protein n=1 Tax=Hohenbuehelia grisea TaxID=104357 RepID=A0ABR3JNJ4_9AGAR